MIHKTDVSDYVNLFTSKTQNNFIYKTKVHKQSRLKVKHKKQKNVKKIWTKLSSNSIQIITINLNIFYV